MLASFAILLVGAYVFTNAIEWAGHRLRLGEGAVGSLLAAVGTALPESIIPVIALIGGGKANDVAVGAILGAPFMLATIAMGLVGVATIVFRKRRPRGTALDVHAPTLTRDLSFFLVLLAVALALGLGAPVSLRYAVAAGLVLAYAVYALLTVRGGGGVQASESLKPLYLDPSRGDPPSSAAIVLQLLVALGAIVGGSHLFVEELLHVADRIGVSALVLSLVLAPLATELPEKANSLLWTREGRTRSPSATSAAPWSSNRHCPSRSAWRSATGRSADHRYSLPHSASAAAPWPCCCCATAAVSASSPSSPGPVSTSSSSPTSLHGAD